MLLDESKGQLSVLMKAVRLVDQMVDQMGCYLVELMADRRALAKVVLMAVR